MALWKGSFTAPALLGPLWKTSSWSQCIYRRYSDYKILEPFEVLFLGRDEFSCAVLEHLHAARDIWSSIDVVTTPDMRIGRRGSQLAVSPLKILSKSLDIPVHFIPPDKPAFRHWQLPPPFSLSDVPPLTHILITASFGRILTNQHLNAFGPGRKLNVHPSILPAYRGASPIQHALIDGRTDTGVSVIEMMERKKGLDSGGIWGMSRTTIPDDTDFVALRHMLAEVGGQLLVKVLRDMLLGQATCIPQVHDPTAPMAPLLRPEDSLVDFAAMSAETIVKRHRAISHQRPLFTFVRSGKTMQLHGISALSSPGGFDDLTECGMAKYCPHCKALIVRCAGHTFLSVSQVKLQDRVQVQAKEWWNGVRPDDRAVVGAHEGPVLLGQ